MEDAPLVVMIGLMQTRTQGSHANEEWEKVAECIGKVQPHSA